MKYLSKINLILGLSALLLSGCTITPLNAGANNIALLNTVSTKNCRYLGQISSKDTNGYSTMYTSHENLEKNEINDLKNQALSVGANTLVLTQHNASYITQSSRTPIGNVRQEGQTINTHQLVANSYYCS